MKCNVRRRQWWLTSFSSFPRTFSESFFSLSAFALMHSIINFLIKYCIGQNMLFDFFTVSLTLIFFY